LIGDLLQAAIWQELTDSLMGTLLPSFEDMMRAGARDALEQVPSTIGVDWDRINIEAAEWAREHAGEAIKSMGETAKDRVRVEVTNWIEAGESLPKLERRLRNVVEAPWKAKQIAITETTNAFAKANVEAWRASRVVNKHEWRTALDERVCPICEPNHGKVRKLGKRFPSGHTRPAAHINCRCWLVPVPD